MSVQEIVRELGRGAQVYSPPIASIGDVVGRLFGKVGRVALGAICAGRPQRLRSSSREAESKSASAAADCVGALGRLYEVSSSGPPCLQGKDG